MAGISASDVNASIPLGAKPPPFNPLETVGNLNQVQQGLLQNRLLGQSVNGKVALGHAVTGATDPNTGETDWNKALGTLSQDPQGAFAVPELAGQVLDRKTKGVQLDKDTLDLSQKRWGVVSGVLDARLSNATPVTPDDVMSLVKNQIIPLGHFNDKDSQGQIVDFVRAMPQPTGNPQTDDQNLRAYMRQISLRADAATEHINSLMGTPTVVNTGAAQVPTRIGGVENKVAPMGSIANVLSPADLTHLNNITDPATGKVKQVPVGEQFDAYGRLKPDADTPAGGGGAASPAGGGQQNGRYPVAAGPRSIGDANLAPGQGDMMAASAKAFNDDTAAVPQIRKVMTAFDQSMDSLKNAKIGVGSDKLQAFRALEDTYGIPLPKNVKDETEAYQEFNKWSSSALAQESSRLGLGTDAARQIQAEAQPGVHTVKGAAIKMLPILKGLKAMDLAAPVIFQASGLPPQQYNAWRATWANGVDPLAFGAGSMSKDQRRELIDKMSPDEKTRYAAGLKAAIQAGVFSRGDLAK